MHFPQMNKVPFDICVRMYIVTRLLEPRIVSQQRRPLIGNGSANIPVARQWLSSHHTMAATDTHATTEELLEVVFSVWSMSGLYNEDQLPLRESHETAVRKVGGWCEMAASL
jgi:hypothetical protein